MTDMTDMHWQFLPSLTRWLYDWAWFCRVQKFCSISFQNLHSVTLQLSRPLLVILMCLHVFPPLFFALLCFNFRLLLCFSNFVLIFLHWFVFCALLLCVAFFCFLLLFALLFALFFAMFFALLFEIAALLCFSCLLCFALGRFAAMVTFRSSASACSHPHEPAVARKYLSDNPHPANSPHIP